MASAIERRIQSLENQNAQMQKAITDLAGPLIASIAITNYLTKKLGITNEEFRDALEKELDENSAKQPVRSEDSGADVSDSGIGDTGVLN